MPLWYTFTMNSAKNTPVVERLLSPLGECLTPETARRLLALKADPDLQLRVDEMATRHTEGQLTADEQSEYGRYVTYASFIAILKSKARQLLASPNGASASNGASRNGE